MAAPEVRQRLAAILAADVVGYTRLMADDETATIATIGDYRDIFRGHIEANEGRVVDMAGDSILAIFNSAAGAVNAAVAAQVALAARNADFSDARRMDFRVGINLGDIREGDDGTVYGDGVNVAARLESLADAGGVMISEFAYAQVRRDPDLEFADAGAHQVKNVAEPVRAYRVLAEGIAAAAVSRSARRPAVIGAGIASLILAGAALWWVTQPPAPETAAVERMALPLPDEPSIAVLPFDNMSGNAEHEYIADGLSENIIAILAQTRGMLVIARNSTFTYKGRAVDVRQVAEEQGVRYVLEGSVQLAGERIRVTAQLVDALAGAHVWSERFDRPVADLFAVQDEITLAIVRAMQVSLTEGGSTVAWHGGTSNLEAWRAFENAKSAIYDFSPSSIAQAQASLQQALAIDPDYAQAEAILSWTYNWQARFFGPLEDQEKNLALAAEHAEAALAKDPNVSEAYDNLAMIRFLSGEVEEAMTLAERAVVLAPNSSFTLTAAGVVFQYAGRYERAASVLARAERITPIRDTFVQSLLAMNSNARGDYEAAEAYARWVSATMQGDHNVGHEQLIFALASSGQLEEARALVTAQLAVAPNFSVSGYRAKRTRCCRPPEAVLARYDEAFRAAGVPEHPPGAEPVRPVIAVLPFDNMSGDPGQAYFADGITDTLITDLSKLRNVGVIARNSTFTYKGRATDVREVGKAMGASHVLEGSVMRVGERIRVNVQLIDAASGEHVWADRFDRPVDDIFAVQDEIVAAIILELDVELVSGEQARLWRRSTESPEAYDVFLRAFYRHELFTRADIARAQQLFQEALDIDPTYAVATHFLAATHYNQSVAGWSASPAESMGAAERLFLRAIELDDSLGEAYAFMGLVYMAKLEHEEALAYAARAVEMTPGASETLAIASVVYIYSGKPDRGLQLIEMATRLEPVPQAWFAHPRGSANIFLGEYERAIADLRACLEALPDYIWCNVNIIIPYMELGMIDEAEAQVREVLRINPEFDVETAVQVTRIKDPASRQRWQALLREAGL